MKKKKKKKVTKYRIVIKIVFILRLLTLYLNKNINNLIHLGIFLV